LAQAILAQAILVQGLLLVLKRHHPRIISHG